MADAAAPAAAAEAAPVAQAEPQRVEALQPVGPPSAEVYALVPELRAALAEALPADATLWGAQLLNADDAAGCTVLGKCVATAMPRNSRPRRPAGSRPPHAQRSSADA